MAVSINEISHRTISCFGEERMQQNLTQYTTRSRFRQDAKRSWFGKRHKKRRSGNFTWGGSGTFFFELFEPTVTLSGINIFYIYIAMFHLIKLNSAARFHQSLYLPNPVGIVWRSVALIDSESVLNGKSIGDQLDWIEGSFEGSGGVGGGATPPGKRIKL